MSEEKKVPQVYASIAQVAADMAAIGIGKDKRNTMQNYNFRGIDDVYNALAPLLAKHSLVILPRMISREVIERITKAGAALFYVTLLAEFDFVSAIDASQHTIRTFGEAMDSGDKATNKAMSAAFKYAAFQTFCIPTEAQDADYETHTVAPERQNPYRQEAERTASHLPEEALPPSRRQPAAKKKPDRTPMGKAAVTQMLENIPEQLEKSQPTYMEQLAEACLDAGKLPLEELSNTTLPGPKSKPRYYGKQIWQFEPEDLFEYLQLYGEKLEIQTRARIEMYYVKVTQQKDEANRSYQTDTIPGEVQPEVPPARLED